MTDALRAVALLTIALERICFRSPNGTPTKNQKRPIRRALTRTLTSREALRQILQTAATATTFTLDTHQ